MKIRSAIPSDIPWMLLELNEFAAFYGVPHLFPDLGYAEKALGDLINRHVVFVAIANDGRPAGFIAGVLTPHMFNPKITTLCEVLWWVGREHRNSRAGAALLAKFIDWGKMNVRWVTLSLSAGSPVNEQSLVKRGFVLRERNFVMEV